MEPGVGTNGEKQANYYHRPFNRRNNCLSLHSLAPLLPPICVLFFTSPLHYIWLSIARQWLPFPSNPARKMGWQLLSRSLKARHNAETALCSSSIPPSSPAFPSAILALLHDYDSSPLWRACPIAQRR